MKLRVLSSTYGSRGDIEPLVGLAAALRALGAPVRVCASPDEDFAQRLPGVGVTLVHCFVVGEVNHQALFPRMAAVVHHGGVGTTTAATRAGTPQVVVPQATDQPYWAGRVADLGIGAAHNGPTPTTRSLSAALRTTLSPETRARATAMARTIRSDGATVAAKLLLDTISRESPPLSA